MPKKKKYNPNWQDWFKYKPIKRKQAIAVQERAEKASLYSNAPRSNPGNQYDINGYRAGGAITSIAQISRKKIKR